MSKNNESDIVFPPEVEKILDIASEPNGEYSALWIPGGIRLVKTADPNRFAVTEFFWPQADEAQRRLRANLKDWMSKYNTYQNP